MPIKAFLDSLEKDREFQLQVTGHNYIPPSEPRYGEIHVSNTVGEALLQNGVASLYSHQTEALGLIRERNNIVIMTPTASGKSLVYNIPVLESIMNDPNAMSLYLFPLKGLEQDQVKNLNGLCETAGIGSRGEVYDGDTPAHKRRQIRESLPNVIFTNPDMLHLALLPFHEKWKDFFGRLRFVVVDEIHSYRGVFGSNVAHIFRRLRRICEHYGSNPQFIASSATIANPEELAGRLTGLPFTLIEKSGSPSPGKHFFFVTPFESPYTFAARLFSQCLRAGLRTIVFTRARKITELIYAWTLNYCPELSEKISPYRAGFLPRERREIEARLFSGELLGVVSTSALELGIDIGGLDCCILCGYPGSVSSTWQRAGRVGRKGQESIVVLAAIQDALDQYIVRHPEEFLEKSHEAVVIDPGNSNILKKHLPCAAAELPLHSDDEVYALGEIEPSVEELLAEGVLYSRKKKSVWFTAVRQPHKEVELRAAGERFSLENERGRQIGELSGERVLREAFPGAVYLHKGKKYKVTELDMEKRKALCTEVSVGYYTQPVSTESTQVLEEKGERRFGGLRFHWGRLRIVSRITGYDRKRTFDKARISSHTLDLPESVFETEGLWTIIPAGVKSSIEEKGFDLGGTLHAVEHTAIASMPLFALCDRGDVGGLSHTCFPEFALPAIFIYDGHEGGLGLTKRAVEHAPEWLRVTLKIIEECPCVQGCPSCVQDSRCGNRNQPLDKAGAGFLLRKWIASING
jgi:DEAD/DEAH box helicase domain-containing protein